MSIPGPRRPRGFLLKLITTDLAFWGFLAVFLGGFLLYPIAGVFKQTFAFGGELSFKLFWHTISGMLVSRALLNSLALGIVAVALTTLMAMPLAFFVARYEFRFKKLASALVLIPMIMPPFVGAIGIRRIFSHYGMINSLTGLDVNWLGDLGFWGVACLQALHLFPIMYLNVTAALANVDPQLEEAAAVAGASRWRVFRDVTLPLLSPGFLAGAIIVFLWSFTDLGTPLVFGYRRVLAVEIFDRIDAINNDPTGAAMVVLVILVTVLFLVVFKRFLGGHTIESASKGQAASVMHRPSAPVMGLFYAYVAVLLFISLLPHVGLILTSVAGDWFMTAFPSDYTMRFFGEAITAPGVAVAVRNSLLYSSLSTIVDVVLGFGIAYYLLRRGIRAGWLVDAIVMLPVALPGLILAFGYVAVFSGTPLDPLKNPIPLLVIGYSVRRLPYCFRAAYAGLQQVSPQYEEAARAAGASASRAALTITVPLIGANLIAGGILAFMFAMLEVSESMVLAVLPQYFPVTRQIYDLLGNIPNGDYVASALGVLCMLFLAGGMMFVSVLMGRRLGRMFRL
ncbi:MAG: iron ABC transporter permease [Planctomycetota bacterium]